MKFNKIYIELTNICGLSCTFCPSKENTPRKISLEQFDTLLSQIKKYTNIITYHIFGDPLTLSNVNEYIALTSKHGLKVEITTTGYFLKNFDLSLFLDPAIRQINFSINSFNANEMKITLDEYLSPIFKLCELKLEKKVHNFINFRLWNLDQNNSADGFNQEVFKKLENRFNIKINDIDYSKSIRLENQILLDFDKYFEWPSLSSNHLSHGFCYGLQSHIGILSNGTVVPCCLDSYGIIELGNIFDTPLQNILSNQKTLNIIENFKNKIAIEQLCQKCTFKDRFS